MKLTLTLLACLAFLPACSGGVTVDASVTSWPSVDIGQTTVVTLDDVTIDIARDVKVSVPMRARVLILTGEGDTQVENHDDGPEVFVRGHELMVEDGQLTIGSVDYGAVTAESKVNVSAAGVFVDGEKRGDVPAAAGD